MATGVTNSSRNLVRAALALALAGLLAVLSGGLLIIVGGPASSVPTADDVCVPSEAWTETVVVTPEVPAWTETIEHPAVTEEVMTDPGSPAVPEVWANWQPNDSQGPQSYTPVWPEDERGTWTVHDEGIPGGHEGPDGVYQQGSGNSPWFYRQNARSAVDPTYQTVVVEEAWTETVQHPAVPAVTEEVDHPAVSCEGETEPPEVLPTDATQPTGPTGPNQPAEPHEPAAPTGPSDATGPEEPAEPEVLGAQATRPDRPTGSVPRAVAAGVGGRTAAQEWGAGLVGGGAVLLLAAGGVLVGARRREAS
jgi:hypothetical protein